MSLISSSTLFHFTSSVHNLVGILENEFHPSLSLESFQLIERHLPGLVMPECAIPMICFCDIPLSQVETHMRHYGDYGLGLSKAWGMKVGVSPVLYAHANSPAPLSSAGLMTLLGSMGLNSAPEDQKALAFLSGRSVYFLKLYEGVLERRGKPKENVRFYDEREWRYIPDQIESIPELSRDDFNDPIKAGPVIEQVRQLPSLSFEPDDINYIVVATDAEALSMVKAVRSIKGKKYDADTVDLLTSKIISAQRIRADF
jgi:hypothetical protein